MTNEEAIEKFKEELRKLLEQEAEKDHYTYCDDASYNDGYDSGKRSGPYLAIELISDVKMPVSNPDASKP